jgi:secreted trypsin-like serine protease
MRLSTALLGFIFAPSCSIAIHRENDGEHPRDLIINGTTTLPTRFPYTVSLQKNSFHFCGGSLIAPNVVLTAAHCWNQDFPEYISANINHHTLTSPQEGSETFEVELALIHPLYSNILQDPGNNDYMLIKLKGSSTLPNVILNADDNQPAVGSNVTVMGWGNTHTSGAYADSDVLQQVEVNTISNEDCLASYPGSVVHDSLCIAEVGQGACQDDSGGPLVVKGANFDTDVQVGVVSWGIGCATATSKSVTVS